MKALERTLNVILVLSAVVMAGLLVRRELVSAGPQAATAARVFHANWHDFLPQGRLLSGSTRSPVQLVEFLDLECPACRQYQPKVLSRVMARYGDSLALTVIHYPLPTHRFAVDAAHGSECAAAQGRFASFVDVALAKQDSFGRKPWTEFAVEANVRDLDRFARCFSQRESPLVAAGGALAGRLGIEGTPTIVVNGWELSGAPSERTLRDEIDMILSGRPRRPSTNARD